jgi:hypothetical protein
MRDYVDGEYNSILASPRGHLITRSARTSTLGGIVRPICLAAFRLITSSNVVFSEVFRGRALHCVILS